jgi:acyl-CoA reductase-like NAD-dependent aldehyde dehydrogenase
MSTTDLSEPIVGWGSGTPAPDLDMYVNGAWISARGGERLEVMDPATGSVIATVPDARAADVREAVSHARAAFDGGKWSRLEPRDRSRLLFRMADILRRDREKLAQLEVRDNGKPLAAALWDIDESAFLFEYYAGWITKLLGDIPPLGSSALSLVESTPVGVAALITPWNFPLLMASQKAAPALAAGCAAILKPAEQTPLTALELARVAEEAELPPGAFNVVTGYGESAGAALVDDPGVDKISFTGSVEVGKQIMARAAGSLKRVTLELGGKSASIVLADADLEPTIDGVSKAVFFNQGQVCGACTRVYLEDAIYDDALAAIERRVAALHPGHGLDPDTTLGPLISREQRERVQRYVAWGEEEGADVTARGSLPGDERLAKGYYASPVVFSGVGDDMRIAREEIFGPVMAVMRFNDIDDVVARANGTQYGLAGAVWSSDLAKALRIARRLRTGTVWINDALQAPSEAIWGGFKSSGVGRELGPWGIEEYLEKRQIYVNLATA